MLRRIVDTGVSRVMAALWSRPQIAVLLIPYLFLSAPDYEFGDEQRAAFESLYETALRSTEDHLDYDLRYPKHEFLAYLSEEKPIVFHGSNSPHLSTLEPREQADYKGDPISAVFASKDPLWTMFFAVIDQESYRGSLRNGGFVINGSGDEMRRYYFFSLSKKGLRMQPWRVGTVYLLPENIFDSPEIDKFGFDEWYSRTPVEPIASLPVEPEEFPLLDDIVGHCESESIFMSWLAYRWRRFHSRSNRRDASYSEPY